MRKAITSDTALAKVAIAEATGNLIMDTRMMADSALQGEKIASRADFNYLVENASQEEISDLTKVFGVEDWGKITVDEFNAKMTELNENGTLKNAAEQMQRVKLAKESETTAHAKALPHRLSPKLSDGVHHYTSENGANIALMKDGDTYHVYDYSTGNISKPMTMQDVNKALKSHYTSAAVLTSSDSKIAAAMPLTEATADLSAETKTAVTSINSENMQVTGDNDNVKAAQEYTSAKENSEVIELIDKVKNKQHKQNDKVYFDTVPTEVAERIFELTGINVEGFEVAIEARQLEHILVEHGLNGRTDQSMKNDSDVAKIEHTLKSPDSIVSSGKTQAYSYMKNGYNRTAQTVLYEKNIGDKAYYVVQAVPDTKSKTLFVVSAFIGEKGYKKGASQLIDAQGPNATSKFGSVVTPTNRIHENSEKINSFEKNSSEKVSSYENLKAQNAEIAKFAEENIKDYKKLNDVNRRAVRAVIRQGRAHGLSDADIITIASVSAHSGAKIKFSKADCKRTNKKGETFYVDGFYDGDTDTITVNPEKTRSTDRLLLHELLHDIVMHLGGSKKGFKIYKKLVKQALNNMSEEQQTAIVAKYQEMGETRASVLTEEILSHYGEAFANKSFFEAMLTERQSLGKRILNFFKSAVTDYAGDERLSRSARKFHKAFK